MVQLINGIDVKLYVKTTTGTDAFNHKTVTEAPVIVSNVLVTPTGTSDLTSAVNLAETKESYELSIPKGDAHDWRNATVEFFGKKWRTVGMPREYIEAMVPLSWNKKVLVERYE